MPKKGPRANAPSSKAIRHRRSCLLASAIASVLVAHPLSTRAANITSTMNPGAGNWSNPAKWSNNPAAATYPNNGNLGNTYDAVINSSSVTLDVAVALRTLTLNGTIAAPGTASANGINVTNGFTFNGGTLNVPVTVPAGATFTLETGTNSRNLGAALTVGGNVVFAGTNAGTLTATVEQTPIHLLPTGTMVLDRQLTISHPPPDPFGNTRPGPTLDNEGVITLAAGANLVAWSPSVLKNRGTIRVTGASTLDFGAIYATGLIDLQTSAAVLNVRTGPGPGVDGMSGSLKLAAGSTLNFAAGWWALAGVSVTNAGTINFRADTTVTAPTTLPGVVNFDTYGKGLTVDSDLFLTGPAMANNTARVSGTGRITASNFTVEYGGATLANAELKIPTGGLLNMASGLVLDGGRVTLDGTARITNSGWGGAGLNGGRVDVGPVGLVDVRPSATANLGHAGSDAGSTPDVLNNAGVIQVDHASLSVGRSWLVNNSGVLRVMAGSSSATMSASAVTNSGTVDLESGASLLVNGDRPASPYVTEFRNTATGVVRIAGSATATLAPIALDATFRNDGLVEVNGGRLTNSGYVFVNGGTVRVTAGTAQLGRALNNTGAIAVPGGVLQLTANQATNAGRIDLTAGGSMTVAPSTNNSSPAFRNAIGGVINVGPSTVASFAGPEANTLSNAGSIVVDHGQLTVGDQWAISNAGAITVTSGTFKFYSATNFSSYTNTGSIDLRGGAGLVVARPTSFFTDQNQTLQRIRDQIVSGYHAGTWDGAGIRSASAAADTTTAVGYAPVTAVGTFLGMPVAVGDVLVRHTKYGDATLDGVVNFGDLLALARAYNTTGVHWYQGDFDYNGTVNFNDLLTLARNYNQAMPAAGEIPGAPAGFEADLAAAFAQASVPEPTGALVCVTVMGAVAVGRRRRFAAP